MTVKIVIHTDYGSFRLTKKIKSLLGLKEKQSYFKSDQEAIEFFNTSNLNSRKVRMDPRLIEVVENYYKENKTHR